MEPVSPEARGDENHRRDDAAELLRLLSAGAMPASSGAKRPLDWVNKPGSGNKADDEAARALLEAWTTGQAA